MNPPSHNGDTTKTSVVIVEDDPSIREVLAGWVSGSGTLELLALFGDGERAVREIPSLKPDVALVDINLPGISGIECVRALKPKTPSTQFVILTIHQESNIIFDALSSGATGYLLKTTPRDDLLKALSSVNRGESPMSGNIARKVIQSFQGPPGEVELSQTLSKRQFEILRMLAQGYLVKEIADSTELSIHTVNTYIRRIYEKLHVQSRSQASAVYARIHRGPDQPSNPSAEI